MTITPELLPLLRDPRRALPAFGHVGTQDGRGGDNVVKYDPGALTHSLQQDILKYWHCPPVDPHTGNAQWMITLAGRQGGKSFTAEAAAYCRTAAANSWQHLCLADTPDRSRELLARVNMLHDLWDPDVRFERKYNNEEWQATFAPMNIGPHRLSVRRMRTQHTGMEPVGAAWDSLHWSEVDFSGDDARRFWSNLLPALVNRSHAVVHLESTGNPGMLTPSVGFLKEMYFAAKNRRSDGSDMNRFIACFYPFWDNKRARRPWNPSWSMEVEEIRLLEKYGSAGLTLEHLAFRREILATDPEIRRDPETFGIWYPFDDLTCWPVIQSGTFQDYHLKRHLNATWLVPWKPVDRAMWYPGHRVAAGVFDPDAAYIMGVDPNGYGGRDHGAAELREVWAEKQTEVASFAGGRMDGVDPEVLARWIIATCEKARAAQVRIKVVVESTGVGAGVITLLKQRPDVVDLYYSDQDRPGVPASAQKKQEALAHHKDALMQDLVLHDEDKVSQHATYRNDKAVEETDTALQLQAGNPSRRRRPRHHWDKVSASMWTSWAVANGLCRRPFIPVVKPPRTKPYPSTAEEWDEFAARGTRKGYAGLDPFSSEYEILP